MATKSTYNGEKLAPFAFEVKKVVREFVRPLSGGTSTIGQMLDEQLAKAARAEEEVQSITLHIEEEEWPDIAENLRQ